MLLEMKAKVMKLKSLAKYFQLVAIVVLSANLHSAYAGGEFSKLSIDLSSQTLIIEVRDAAAVNTISSTLGSPAKIPFEASEADLVLNFYSTLKDPQELKATIVADLKDMVDQIAAQSGEEKFTSLDESTKAKLSALAELRVQLALNWAEFHLALKQSNNPKLSLGVKPSPT